MRRIKRTGRGACHLALVLWATFVLGGAAHAEAPDALDRLLASFAQVEGFEAQFREEKHIALLVAPLVNEGGVHYARPGMFARHTRTPERKSLVVRAGKVEFGTAAKGERVDTAKNPLARQVVDAYLGLVGGDRKRLEAAFTLSFEGNSDAEWTLRMVPRDARLRTVFSGLEFQGVGVRLVRLVVREGGGDWSETTFHGVIVPRTYGAPERERIFRLP